jgi:hypothetical protein
MNSPPTGGLSGQDTLHQAASAPGTPWGRKPAVTTVPTGNHNRRSTTVSAMISATGPYMACRGQGCASHDTDTAGAIILPDAPVQTTTGRRLRR